MDFVLKILLLDNVKKVKMNKKQEKFYYWIM